MWAKSRELGISDKTLYYWIRQYNDQEEAFPGRGILKPSDQKYQALEKQLRDLEEENAILKKATHFFTKNRK
ncbi:transposase [Marininema mesophilum]|uniref:transposase n=1 Tax=Marininema mesophilum TaxID=1048340 RepID=UPI000B842689